MPLSLIKLGLDLIYFLMEESIWDEFDVQFMLLLVNRYLEKVLTIIILKNRYQN